MLCEQHIVNAADRRVRVPFPEAWFHHAGLLAWIPAQDTGNNLSNSEQKAFHERVEIESISLSQGCRSTLRLAVNERGVIATVPGQKAMTPRFAST